MNKVYPDAKSALSGLIKDGLVMAVGGFGLVGMPELLIQEIRDSGIRNITCISNNGGVTGKGLGMLLDSRQISKMVASYIGESREFERQYLAGELEVEFTPQGTLAEKLRAGGAGIPAFFTATGYGTVVADGKEEREFDGKHYILERSLTADIALVRAFKADQAGNLVFNKTARNFNPLVAKAAKVCIVEAEHLVEMGEIDPDQVHLPGIYVQRIVHNPHPVKHVEKRTVRS